MDSEPGSETNDLGRAAMTPLQALSRIYSLALARGQKRVSVIEQYLGIAAPLSLSVDDVRNERDYYGALTADSGTTLLDCLRWLLKDLIGVSDEEGEGIIDGVDFVQSAAADALWRYEFPVSEPLEQFARDYDRLDVAEERRRLYVSAQQILRDLNDGED